MHAVVVNVDIDPARGDEARQFLHTVVVPGSIQWPGFVSGTWGRSVEGTHGVGMILFETEAAARNAAEQAVERPPGAPLEIVSAEVFEVQAQAP